MYSAVIRSGKVEIQESSGEARKTTKKKKKKTIGGEEPGVEAIGVDLAGDQVTINWSDGSASVHSLPGGEVIRKL